MRSRRTLPQLAGFGFGAAFAVAFAVPVSGQTATLSDAWAAYLRPGCHVLLVLPATQLEVQTKWLGPITVGHLANVYHGVCPAEPVKVTSVEFGHPVLDVLRIQTGLGHDFFRLFVDPARAPDASISASPQEPPHAESVPALESSIKMLKNKDLGLKDLGSESRWYDISYQSLDEALSGEVRIICAATRDFVKLHGQINYRERNCRTARLPRFHGLTVMYTLSQWRLPAPEDVSTDPTTEPGAILQFDKRLREWLISLERPK